MKKLISFLFALMAVVSVNADELFLVGDATPIGWLYGGRNATQMTESEGCYTWTGFLKKGGFKICTAHETWDGYHPETADLEIDVEGNTQPMTTDNGADYKWKVVNPGIFQVTVDLSSSPKTIAIIPIWTNISTADELIAFAESVNAATEDNHNGGRWARLTSNIDMDGKTFPGIGRDDKWVRYHGTFDGQGHVISNLNMTSEHCAFVTVAGGGCTVKNLLIDSSCEFNGSGRNAALISCCNYTDFGTPLTIESCGNEANVTGTSNNCAGLLGCNYGNGIKVTIKNSFNAGNIISSGSESAPISGWLGSNARVENTYNIGNIENVRSNNSFARWDGSGSSYENCYSTLAWGNSITGKTLGYDINNVTSGLLCFTLNGNESGGEAWKQTLPSSTGDSHPYPGVFAGHAKVYANGDTHCDGSAKGTVTYSNTEGENRDAHDYQDGFCSYCHTIDVTYLTPVDGFYEIDNMNKLHWFSQYVTAGNATANAKLTEDITMESENQYGYTPIGSASHPYTGHFDGQGHSVTLKINNPGFNYQGLFGIVKDGVFIEKVIVNGYVNGDNYVGGIVGGTDGTGNGSQQTRIWNCGNEAAIKANGANGAGIIGVNMNGFASIILLDCYNTGNITSGSDGGAMSGWLGGGWSNVRNCYNIGTVTTDGKTSKAFGRNSGCYFTNCYYTEGSGTDNTSENTQNGIPTMVTDAALASGELCVKLGDAFYQALGTDDYPTTNFYKPSVYKIGAAGYATLYDTTTGYEFAGDVKAYVATLGGNGHSEWLVLTEIEKVPASSPVILKGTYYNKIAAKVDAINIANELKGTDTATEADGTMYVLAKKNDKVGFYLAEGTIPAGKAYFQSTSGVKAFYFDGDDATGIEMVNGQSSMVNGQSIYNVAGQKLSKMQKGINIVNGKKILK